MPVTFGSVGDIIAVCLLIRDLVRCLDDSRGSSAEHQAATRQLQSLDHAILEVHMFLSCQESQELDVPQQTALRIAEQCAECITRYRERVKRYNGSLQQGGSASFMRDTAMKLRWSLSEKEHLAKFRAEIIVHYLSLNTLLTSSSVKATVLSDKNLRQGFNRNKLDQDHVSATQEAIFKTIETRLEENREEVRVITTVAETSRTSIGYMQQLGAEMLSVMRSIWMTNIVIYRAVITLQKSLPQQVERQESVTLRDPLGRITPVPLELVATWEAFQSILEIQFRGLPGHGKVQRNEYSLHPVRPNKEIDSALAFRHWFQPGQVVDMSMVFDSLAIRSKSCPGCNLSSMETSDSTTK